MRISVSWRVTLRSLSDRFKIVGKTADFITTVEEIRVPS